MGYFSQTSLIVVGLVALAINLALLAFGFGEYGQQQIGTWSRFAVGDMVRTKAVKAFLLCTFICEIVRRKPLPDVVQVIRYLAICFDLVLTFVTVKRIDRMRGEADDPY